MTMGDEPYNGRPPFVEGSDTSEEASDAKAASAGADRTRVLHHIRRCGDRGATCWEVEVELHMPHQTASARICDLKERGLLTDSLARRLTGNGCQAQVLVAKASAVLVTPKIHLTLREQNRALREENEDLRRENAQLREQNRTLILLGKDRNSAPRQMPLRGLKEEKS